MKNIITAKANLAKAAFQVDFSKAPDDIEYMPAGEHIISCTVNGEPKEVRILCDEACAEVFQNSLDAVFSEFDAGRMSKPFIDFDHEGGEAAAFPRRFFWRDGLRLELEWTDAGRRAVEEKRYNYFSPEFLFDAAGEPKGVSYPGAVGALVNVPAFQTIEKISAKQTQTKGRNMADEEKEPTVEELQEQLKTKDDEIAGLKAQLEEKAPPPDDEIQALKARVEELEKGKEKAEEEAAQARLAAISDRAEALVKAGRVKASGKDALIKAALASDDNGKAIFDAIPEAPLGAPPFECGREPPADGGPKGIARAAAAFNRQISAKG